MEVPGRRPPQALGQRSTCSVGRSGGMPSWARSSLHFCGMTGKSMIETQRAYEMNSKAIQTTDRMLQFVTSNL